MKRITVLLVLFSFVAFHLGYVPHVSAGEMVTETISSVSKAKEIAEAAGGGYWEGAVPPRTTATEVALPVIDKSGNTMGFIVADKAKLVAALNAEGYTTVASALAAAQAGSAAGLAVGGGIAMGTVGIAAATVAVVGGIALIVSGGDETTTSHHVTSQHH